VIGRGRWRRHPDRSGRLPVSASPPARAVHDLVSGWAGSIPDPSSSRLWAAVFADDLCRACTQAFDVLSDGTQDVLPLAISVPFDEKGVVVLSSAPPKPDAPRVPAELELIRPAGQSASFRFGLALARRDRAPLLVPGLRGATTGVAPGADDPVPLTLLTFAVADDGMAVAGYGTDGLAVPLDLDETTARALAVALLITVGVKLAKAGYRG
jgi:hypothetical protein